MDTGEALGYDGPDAEVERSQRRVLAARSLPVVVSSDDETGCHLLRLLVVLGVEAAEGELGYLGHVGTERHDLDSVRREVAG